MARALLWRSLVLLAGLTGASWTAPPSARAETIGLDQGYVTIADDQGMFRFAIGNARFSATTRPPLRSFTGSGFEIGCAALACLPGEHLEMNNASDGTVGLGVGSAFYRGVAYDGVGFAGRWRFLSRGADAPRDGSPTWTPMVPFAFFGTLTATTRGIAGRRDLFSIAIQGDGVARADLRVGELGYELAPGGVFTYKFKPASITPEPASLLLIATGTGMLWRRSTRGGRAR